MHWSWRVFFGDLNFVGDVRYQKILRIRGYALEKIRSDQLLLSQETEAANSVERNSGDVEFGGDVGCVCQTHIRDDAVWFWC
ncbi:hypothetical protein JHK82_054042 [Glycine max]|nr:hypothetical protein JHK82_054042 [Glycine max]